MELLKPFLELDTVEKEEYEGRMVDFLSNPPFSLDDIEGKKENVFSRKEDMKKALDYLKTFKDEVLSTRKILMVANQVNESNPYISRGYRTFGDMLDETKTPIPDASKIPSLMEKLVYDYQVTWKDLEPFEREARFFLEMIHIHPFEDGNRRTAFLFVNEHLMNEGYAPVYLTGNVYQEYLDNIQDYMVSDMTNLFQKQSSKEAEKVIELYSSKQK